MPPAEARYHMKRCVESGLWKPAGMLNLFLLSIPQMNATEVVSIHTLGRPDTDIHSVRCMHAIIGKSTNLHFGILNKSEILGLKGLKVCP